MAKYALEAMRRIAKDEKKGKNVFTASDTGARKEALKRFAKGSNSFGGYVKNLVKGGIKGGMNAVGPSQAEMEETIKRSR